MAQTIVAAGKHSPGDSLSWAFAVAVQHFNKANEAPEAKATEGGTPDA